MGQISIHNTGYLSAIGYYPKLEVLTDIFGMIK